MRTVLQRVSRARVTVAGRVAGEIGCGFLLLVGFTHNDADEQLRWTARKVAGLRIFEDDAGQMNLSLADVGGELLVVSQFTLYADVRKGRRPAFIQAAQPEAATGLYAKFCRLLEDEGFKVERGRFGERMEVELVNEGPVTIIIER